MNVPIVHVFVRRLALAGILAACTPAMAQPGDWKPGRIPDVAPPSENVEKARQLKALADKLYEADRLSEALAKYKEAYGFAPHPVLLYNIGQIASSLPDYLVAVRAYEEYLAAAGADPEHREIVERDLRELRKHVAQVQVNVNADGTEISIDDEPVGRSPLKKTLTVSPGKHKVVAARLPDSSQTKSVTAVEGLTTKVSFEFAPPVLPPTLPPPMPEVTKPLTKPWCPPRWARWTMAGATIALTAAAATTGGLALRESNDLRDRKFVDPPPGDASATSSRIRSLSLASDVLLGAATASLAGTLYLWLVGSACHGEPGEPRGAERKLSVQISPKGIQVGTEF